MRQLVLDTETTGLDPRQGHRVIEIGCVELIDRRLTGKYFHYYLQPDRQIDAGAIQVHGITNEFLHDKPRFAEIADELLDFVTDAELIIHNAPFDLGFLNHELNLLGRNAMIQQLCRIEDTLVLARRMHPGKRNSLDALCERYQVDNSKRDKHGALLDSEILADLYLIMTGGQNELLLDPSDTDKNAFGKRAVVKKGLASMVIRPTDAELQAHQDYLIFLQEQSKNNCLWLKD
jgi:DNA polymerase-3 subunit epsilon